MLVPAIFSQLGRLLGDGMVGDIIDTETELVTLLHYDQHTKNQWPQEGQTDENASL
jgi:hypothetical protein